MAVFIFPGRSPRGTRPAGPFQVNRQRTAALGVSLWYPLQYDTRELITGYTPTAVVGNAVEPYTFGGAVRVQTANTEGLEITSALPAFNIDEGWLSLTVRPTNDSAIQGLFESRGTGAFELTDFHGNFGIGLRLLYGTDSIATTTIALYERAHFVFSWSRARDLIQLWKNGVSVNTATTLSASTGTSFWLGRNFSAGEGFLGQVHDFVLGTRPINDDDAWNLYNDPWQFYWVPGRRMFFDMAAAFDAALFPRTVFADFLRRRHTMTPSGRVA